MTTDEDGPIVLGGAYSPAVLRCGNLRYDAVAVERFRARRSYRLYAVLDGVVDLLGRTGRQRFGPDDLLLLPPGGDRRLRFGRSAALVHAVFDVVPVPRRKSERGGWRHRGRPPQQPGPRAVWGVDLPRRVPAHLAPSGLDMLLLVRAVYWRGAPGYGRANGHLAAWLGDLVDAVAGDRPMAGAADPPPVLAAALEVVDDPRMAPLTVTAAARRAGVSREHLARLARRHLGTTMHDLAEHRRRAMAARLLVETDHPVAAIGQLLGYRQAPSFHRAFRRWFGMTPAAFRKQGA